MIYMLYAKNPWKYLDRGTKPTRMSKYEHHHSCPPLFRTSVPSLQFSSFLSDVSSIRGAANRRGIAVCSVAPNPPSASALRSEHSPIHKVSWEGEESREDMLERVRGEREEEWGARAFELERTQRRGGPQGKSTRTLTCTCGHVLIKKTKYSRP